MESNNLTSPPVIETSRPGIGTLIIKVFTQPSEAFKHLKKKTDWLIPFIIIGIVATLLGHFLKPLYINDMMPVVMRNMEKYREMMGEQQYNRTIQQMEEEQAKALKGDFDWKSPIILFLMYFVFFMVIASLSLMAGNFIFGGRASFWLVVNVVAFAALIGLLGDVVRGAMAFMKESTLVYTGLGLLKPVDNGTFSFYLFRQIDLFSIWRIVATCIGLGVLYNLKASRFMFVLFPLWFVFICIVALLNMYIMMGGLIY